jgi:internalin A
LHKLDAECPAMVTIAPEQSRMLNESNVFATHYRVQLWCQMPDCPHPLGEWYDLPQPKDWLIKLKPWMSTILQTLQFIIPAAGVAQSFVPQEVWKKAEDQFAAMTELVAILPDVKDKFREYDLPEREHSAARISGAGLRVIYELLHHLDSSHKWGGLRRTTTPEGDILWLCPTHYKVFDPGLPDLSGKK